MKKLYENMNRHQVIQLEAISIADWMIEHESTVRQLSREFCMTRSTVHKRLTVDLRDVDYDRYKQCQRILKFHKDDAVNRMVKAKKKPQK